MLWRGRKQGAEGRKGSDERNGMRDGKCRTDNFVAKKRRERGGGRNEEGNAKGRT
jgi:hypothetical protein